MSETCDHWREPVVRTGEAPNLGRTADPITLTCVVTDPQPEYMVEISEGSE